MIRTSFVLVCALLAPGCQDAGDQPSSVAAPRPEGPVWHHTLPSNPIPDVLARYDRDHDGYLSVAEKEEIKARIAERRRWQREELLGRYDANHDGKIEGAEKEALKRDRDEVRAQIHAAALRKYDANGDGVLDAGEKATMARDNSAFLASLRAQALSRYDANGNGVLDPEERATIRAAAHQSWNPDLKPSPTTQP